MKKGKEKEYRGIVAIIIIVIFSLMLVYYYLNNHPSESSGNKSFNVPLEAPAPPADNNSGTQKQ